MSNQASPSTRVSRDPEEKLGHLDPLERRASSECRGSLDTQVLLEIRETKAHRASSDGLEIKENEAILALLVNGVSRVQG